MIKNLEWFEKLDNSLRFDKEDDMDVVFFEVAFIMPGEGPVLESIEKDKLMDFMMLMYEANIPVSILGYCS